MAMSYKERQQRINSMKARLDKLKSENSQETRKREARKLILKGRLVERWIEWGLISEQEFMHGSRGMDKFLDRNYDRELFEFEPLAEESPPAKKQERATKDTRPIQVQTPKEEPAEKSTFQQAAHTGRKLAEAGVNLDDFLLQ
jgi:hypothetical protein